MFKLFILFITLSISSISNAYVDCPVAKIKYIQSDTSLVYIQLEDQDWQKLGDYDQKSMSAKLSVALAAHASGKKVKIRFPDGHDEKCNTFNSSTSATMIRITDEQ